MWECHNLGLSFFKSERDVEKGGLSETRHHLTSAPVSSASRTQGPALACIQA